MAAYVYTDVTTERPADYWELYDKNGDLLAVSWFDRFGVQMTAVDRGILEEKDQTRGNSRRRLNRRLNMTKSLL